MTKISSAAQKTLFDAPTPMMAQYLAVKEQYPDCLVFYRMGDFYELFFEDAIKAAAALDITLTRRGAHQGADIPMCGVPWHSHESYLARLIRQGYKVAICEQVETPEDAKKRGGYKALVKRDIVRVVTSGTLTEDSLLDTRTHNYLAAVADISGSLGVAWFDLSTGDFTLQALNSSLELSMALVRIQPCEILLSEKTAQNQSLFEVFAEWKQILTLQPAIRFDAQNAQKTLQNFFSVATLDSFGTFSRAEIAAAGALMSYVELTQKGKVPRFSQPRHLSEGSILAIDGATRRNLELTLTLQGEKQGSLLQTLDMTVTAAGARQLAKNLSMPLTDPFEINHRLDVVEFFVEHVSLRENVRSLLKSCADIERSMARLSLERGGPRDLLALRETLSQAASLVRQLPIENMPIQLGTARARLKVWGRHHPLIDQLERALKTDPPVLVRDGGFIAEGYSPKLDELRTLKDESRSHVATLQEDYIRLTGISSLRIKHNNILGYFIEVTATHADKMFEKTEHFIHRQTMANAARFTTLDLSDFERKISESTEKAIALEIELFSHLSREVLSQAEDIAAASEALSEIDVAAALAELAVKNRYVRPEVNNGLSFEIKGGRHPVVEQALQRRDTEFIANDCHLEAEGRLWLLTGPNMAGKSTFLRQNALISLMAQMGSYVPATFAKIGVVDRLFSRVGAADDLARGHSTFMVEMVETATILHQATERSLVILDEIGRGTATFDGLSIAWACLEYLHEKSCCRGLFATHYHELTALKETLSCLACHTMKVSEGQGDVIFLHEVQAGVANRSYGIHVARLAGLPAAVVTRAQEVLEQLEANKDSANSLSNIPLLDFEKERDTHSSVLALELLKFDIDSLSPKQALDVLYHLKSFL